MNIAFFSDRCVYLYYSIIFQEFITLEKIIFYLNLALTRLLIGNVWHYFNLYLMFILLFLILKLLQ